MPDSDSAADAPISAGMSPSISGFSDITVAMICTSLREVFREQRAARAVDQAGDQRLLLGLAAFALEEATRDAAAGVELLHVVDGQREEILAFLRVLVADRGDQHDGVAHLAR